MQNAVCSQFGKASADSCRFSYQSFVAWMEEYAAEVYDIRNRQEQACRGTRTAIIRVGSPDRALST